MIDGGLSDEELKVAQHILNKAPLVIGFVNDLYSFAREFDDHFKAGTLDAIHNAMAVLMGGYGYSEEEAIGILKQEISAAERDIMERYAAWESSETSKPERLRKFVVYAILAIGGILYWMSFSERYHRQDITATAADRAQSTSNGTTELKKLKGYPAPAASQQAGQRQVNGNSKGPQQDVGQENMEDTLAELLVPFKCATETGHDVRYQSSNLAFSTELI